MIRQAAKLAACAPLNVSMGAFAEAPPEEAAEWPAWTITELKLDYAGADEMALPLSQVLPPTVRVVAYPPTNSLIIAGYPAIVSALAKDAPDVADHGGDPSVTREGRAAARTMRRRFSPIGK